MKIPSVTDAIILAIEYITQYFGLSWETCTHAMFNAVGEFEKIHRAFELPGTACTVFVLKIIPV